jgi:hypothetical protein
VTLSFLDERYFLTVTHLVLPLNEASTEPVHGAAEAAIDPAAIESAAELLPAAAGSALNDTTMIQHCSNVVHFSSSNGPNLTRCYSSHASE